MVERLNGIQKVRGSTPLTSTCRFGFGRTDPVQPVAIT